MQITNLNLNKNTLTLVYNKTTINFNLKLRQIEIILNEIIKNPKKLKEEIKLKTAIDVFINENTIRCFIDESQDAQMIINAFKDLKLL